MDSEFDGNESQEKGERQDAAFSPSLRAEESRAKQSEQKESAMESKEGLDQIFVGYLPDGI